MCIVCGVPLELATESPQANQERDLIRQLIAEGLTKEEIKDHLVAEYGTEVLATPDSSGFDLAAWVVPGAAIVIAGGAIFVAVRRWRRAGTAANEGRFRGTGAGSERRGDEAAGRGSRAVRPVASAHRHSRGDLASTVDARSPHPAEIARTARVGVPMRTSALNSEQERETSMCPGCYGIGCNERAREPIR